MFVTFGSRTLLILSLCAAALIGSNVASSKPELAAAHNRWAASGTQFASCGRLPTPAIVQSVRVPGRPGFVLLTKDSLWVAIAAARPGRRGAVVRIDPA